MGKLIEKYSSALKGEEVKRKEIKAKETSQDPLERYRVAKEEGQVFSIVFDVATPEGNLFGEDEFGVTIVLEGEDLAKDLSYFNPQIKDKFISIDFNVKVKEIDEDKNTVFVRSATSNRGTTRSKLIAEIRSELNEGKEVIVPGTVISVNDKRALINILGQGILGICQIKHWTNGYQRTLVKSIEKGDMFDFLITKPLPQKGHTTQAFELTRDTITKDPWDEIPEYITKDAVIEVIVVERPDNKTYWWGKCKKIVGIEIQCDYNDKLGRPLIGAKYKCKVKRCDAKAHKLTAAPFELVSQDAGTRAAVNFYKNTRRKKQ